MCNRPFLIWSFGQAPMTIVVLRHRHTVCFSPCQLFNFVGKICQSPKLKSAFENELDRRSTIIGYCNSVE